MSLSDSWNKIKNIFRGSPQWNSSVYEPKESAAPIIVPARGGVYDFHLVPRFRWSSTNKTSIDRLAEYATKYEENARSHLLHLVWSTVREFEALDATGVEGRIAGVVGSWCYPEENETVRCTASVRVLVDPRLREELHSVEARGLSLRAEFELARRHADNVERLTETWLGIFQRLQHLQRMDQAERQFHLPFAASLADTRFDEVAHALTDRRREWSVELADLLSLAGRDHEDVGLFEFAKTYDKAVQAFCRQVGLDPLSSVFGPKDEPPVRPAAHNGASS